MELQGVKLTRGDLGLVRNGKDLVLKVKLEK